VDLAEAGRMRTTRNGAASGSEQQTAQQPREPPRHASVQQAGQPIDPDRDVASQTWGRHPWLSGAMQEVVNPLSCSESRFSARPPRPTGLRICQKVQIWAETLKTPLILDAREFISLER